MIPNLSIPKDVIKKLGRDEVLIFATLDDDPRVKQARVLIGDEYYYVDRDQIVACGKDYR